MGRTGRHGVAVLIALAVLLTIQAAPVTAMALQRTWVAGVGTSPANGSVTIRAYVGSTGSIRYALKGLRAHAPYAVQVR